MYLVREGVWERKGNPGSEVREGGTDELLKRMIVNEEE